MSSNLFFVLSGLICLYFGAEWLVSGTTSLARRMGIPALLVGLTVVAFGTSAPEVVVGINAALSGHGDLAIGNILGSNIANIGLIMGLSLILTPAEINREVIYREVPMLILSVVLLATVFIDGRVSRVEGTVLIAAALMYVGWMIRDAARSRRDAAMVALTSNEAAMDAGGISGRGVRSLVIFSIVGVLGLALGAELLVDGASAIAQELGMSERLVGLTIVAVGTSLPELAASVIAAVRGHSDVVVGNVIGSNIFNVLLCLGAAATFAPITFNRDGIWIDIVVCIVATLFISGLIRRGRPISRWYGCALILGYMGYLVLTLSRL
jgi:cation:H+ antiporter